MPRPRTLYPLLLLGLLIVGIVPGRVSAQETDEDRDSDHYEHRFDNPERYADDWNDPARDQWQKPQAVITAMELEAGMTVADVGAGTGYFVPHLARAVGPDGRVLAVDIEPAMLRYVADLAEEQDIGNVDTVHAQPADTGLPPSSVDRVLSVNTWHHIPDRGAYARHLAGRLKEGGSVWVVDFTKGARRGPPPAHRLTPEEVVRELEAGGLAAEVRDLGLPQQFVVVGRPE
jgi:ubiquinone/menaquinone biosynthesis C-methylase UbiE